MQRNIAHWAFLGVSLGIQWTLGCASAPSAAQSPAEAPGASEGEHAAAQPGIAHRAAAERDPSARGDVVQVSANAGGSRRVLPWLSPSHVAAAVRAQEPAFVACQAFSNEARTSAGKVTVGWLVDPDGSVAEVTLGRSTFASDLVNECVLSVARQVSFPASASSAQVFWTIRLGGSERGPFAEAANPRNRR